MQVARGRDVHEADDVAVLEEAQGLVEVEGRLVPFGVEEPFVVGVFVVVAGDLLLIRTNGVCLDVRVEKTTAVTNVFEGDAGTDGDF